MVEPKMRKISKYKQQFIQVLVAQMEFWCSNGGARSTVDNTV